MARLSPAALAVALLAVAAAPWGCGKRTSSPALQSDGPLKVGLVADQAGIDDQSFNAAAWAGVQQAAKGGKIKPAMVESREQSDYATNLSSMADQGCGLVVAVGYLLEDALKSVAPRYPKTRFVIIDGSAPALPNCAAIKFREHEGTFLAGFLAASVAGNGAIAFVGGMESPVIKRFEVGYRAGARTARPDSRVIVKYVGSWTDIARAKEMALAAIKDGAKVVMHAAGKAGLGVLDAAAESGDDVYGIGTDMDQDGLHKGRILTSMMKGIDKSVSDITTDLANGKWTAGDRLLGLKEEGVHLSPMTYTKSVVPAGVLAKLQVISRDISSGKLKVPTTEEEIQAFVPPTY